MTEKITQGEDRFDDIVNFRELISTIWNQKWIIIIFTVLAGVSAFLVTMFLITPQYESASYVIVSEPVIRAELDDSIQYFPAFPDVGAIVQLAEAEIIIEEVLQSLGLVGYEDQHNLEIKTSLQGVSQLRLSIITDDPKMAAMIVNTWAEVMVDRLNDFYGTGDQTLLVLENEVKAAGENWATTQDTFESYLPSSQLETLQVQFDISSKDLGANLEKIDHNHLLISDAKALQAQMESYPNYEPMATGLVLSFINLYQQTSDINSGSSIIIQFDDSLTEDITIAHGIELISYLTIALTDQNSEIEQMILDIIEEISSLTVALEQEQYRIDQLILERDLARSAYTALANQLIETRITQAQEEHSVKIGAKAVVPKIPSSPSIIMNSAVSASIAFILVVTFVLVQDWWIDGNNEQE